MEKKNKPITDKQIATFTDLIKQGMLQHLEETMRWDAVDLINEFLDKFREPAEDEILATPSNCADYFYYADKEHQLLKELILRISISESPEDIIEDVKEILEVNDVRDTNLLENHSCRENRDTLIKMLNINVLSSAEEIIDELKRRIL